MIRQPFHDIPHRRVALGDLGGAIGHHPRRRVHVHQLQPLDSGVKACERELVILVARRQANDERLEQLAALEPPVLSRAEHGLRRRQRGARRCIVVVPQRRPALAGIRADRDVDGAELVRERRGLAIQRRCIRGVAALAREVRQVVQRGEPVAVVAQRRVEAQRIRQRIVRRREVSAAQPDDAKVHRRARGHVERLRVARDRERRAERVSASEVVARTHARHAERQVGARLHGAIATLARA